MPSAPAVRHRSPAPRRREPPAALDAQIAGLEGKLARLYQQRRARDAGTFLLAVLEVVDDWFTAHELCALAPLSPTLSTALAGTSPKSLGKRLRQIADAQDRADEVPRLRLLRHKTTTAAIVWKIETYLPACRAPGDGR